MTTRILIIISASVRSGNAFVRGRNEIVHGRNEKDNAIPAEIMMRKVNKTTIKTVKRAVSTFLAVILAVFVFGCGANESIMKSGKETPSPTNAATPLSGIDKDIDDMRTAEFQFIYVLRRKDGGVFDEDEKGVIKLQTAEANRRVSSDGGKAVVVGSNFALPPQNYVILYNRFVVENYSKQPIVSQSNAANVSNVNK
jgi:hypothetical protein